MNTVLFVNATIGFSENLFLVTENKSNLPNMIRDRHRIIPYLICNYICLLFISYSFKCQ